VRERELATKRLAEIEAQLEDRRLEAEKLEREIEEERRRAEERLAKIREEKELAENEQRKQAEAIKQELKRAELRLRQINNSGSSGAEVPSNEDSSPVPIEQVSEQMVPEEPSLRPFVATVLPAQNFKPAETPDITFHTISRETPSRNRFMVIGAVGAVLAVIAVGYWFISQPTAPPEQPTAAAKNGSGFPQHEQLEVPQAAQQVEINSAVGSNTSSSAVSNSNRPTDLQVIPAKDTAVDEQPAVHRDASSTQNPAPVKKRTPAAARPQNTKKVTADDLINDN
jgi:hypothetical protein